MCRTKTKVQTTEIPPALLPHQVSGVEWLLQHPRGILADGCGMGKTITTVAAGRKLGRPMIVVCPPSVVSEWKRWLGPRDQAWSWGALPAVERSIWWGDKIDLAGFELPWGYQLVLDEGQKAVNKESDRTQAVLHLSQRAAGCWVLSGTPMMNTTWDLHTLLKVIDPSGSASGWGVAFWFDNRDAIRHRLAKWMLRRTKAELRLPPKRYEVWSVDEGGGGTFHETAEGIRAGKDLMAARRRAAAAKFWAVAPRIMALPGPVVVFSAHREPIEALQSWGWPAILGDTSKAKRAEIIRAFQAGELPGIGITTAANEGVTLTRAQTMIRVDLCWTVSGNMQAEDRIHRIGQDKPVTIIDVVGAGVDRKVYDVLQRKQRIMEGLDLI